MRAINAKHSAGENQFGVKLSDLRDLAKKIKRDLDVLKDYPVPKGCTSLFAPIWIACLLEHQE